MFLQRHELNLKGVFSEQLSEYRLLLELFYRFSKALLPLA